MAIMDAMTMKMDAQYKELKSNPKPLAPDQDDDNIPMSWEEEVKFMQTFQKTHFYNNYRGHDSNRDNWRSSKRNDYNRENYQSNTDDKPCDLQRQFNDFMKAQQATNAFVKETFMDLKAQLEVVAKNHQAFIQKLKSMFDRLADKQSSRPSGSLHSNTQPNPRAHINFKSDDEEDEPTPHLKSQTPKPVKETLMSKPYKPKIPYPQRLRKEKIEAQYGKFLDMIRTVRINVPLVDVLAGMPNYKKFLKELISNKHKNEQISAAFLSDESSAMIQNKVPPKLGDPESFLIPFGKFTFPVDFVILEMEEDSKILLILGRLFLHTADAIIRVKQKQLTFAVGTEHEESVILHSIEGTPLEKEIFAEFDEFMAMTIDENNDSESDEEEPKFEKITINTDYKIKTSLEEPPMDLELKPLLITWNMYS
nr:hypothetical protein [Tanacetum cinerariifolium]